MNSSTWQKIHLGEHCEVFSGFPFKSDRFTDNPGDIALVKGDNVGQGEILWGISKRWPLEDVRELERYKLMPGDVVLAMDRPWVPAGLKFARIPESAPESLLVQRVARLRAKGKLEQGYLTYVIASTHFEAYVQNIGRGVGVPHISGKEIGAFNFCMPPRLTQLRIASILSAYDDLIENNRRRMALLEESARQLYNEWFVRLRFPGHEHTRIVDGVPEGWEKCIISELGDIITGKTPSTKDEDNFGGDVQFIKTPDMHGNVFVLQTETYLTEKGANSQSGKFLPPGSILISCIGTVGVVTLTSERCQFNQQINALIPSNDLLRYYCYFAFKELKPRLEAIGGGVTMANVSKGKFESLDITRPATKLLRSFDEINRPVFKQIQTLALQNQKLRTARDLLLPKLMSGEIAV